MKRSVLVLLSLLIISFSASAQCKGFAKNVCKLELLPYIHDGVYNATILSEGETAELFKTFYSGQEYRITVCGDDKLPDLEFEVLDGQRNVLYNNKSDNLNKSFDFKLESSQQLIISIQVPTTEDMTDKISSGCVSVLIGFLNKEDTFNQF